MAKTTYLVDIDLNQNQLSNARIQNLASAPSNPVEGQIYYNTGDDTIYYRTASAWVSVAGDITSVVAGTGLTGGGTSGAATLNVIGGTGITANANDIAITAGGVDTTQLADDAVTAAKLANAINTLISDNTAKNTNVTTNLSITGTTDARTIVSSDGADVVLPVATTSVSGVMSTDLFDASAANSLKVTNATHTGEVTGSGVLTIANNKVDEANLKVSNAPTNGQFLSAQSGNTGGLTWAAIPTLNQNTTGTAAGLSAVLPVNKGGTGAANLNALVQTTGAQTITGVKTFNDHVLVGTNRSLYFRDGNSLIWSPTANDIEVVATTITLDASNDIQLEGNTTVTGNFSVSGTLNVDGSTTTIDSTTVAIADGMLKLAKDQANTADVIDFGFYGQYGVGGTHKYAGVFRDGSATGDPFTFFDGLQAEPGITVNTAGTGYDLANITAGAIKADDGFQGDITGDVTGNADTVTTNANLTGHITSSGNAAVLGSFTVAQLSTALSNASISGNNTGDQTTVSGSSGSCTGLAATATALANPREINEVEFDGTGDITITAAAGTLSGNTLKSTVVTSSLTSVGTIGTGVWNATEIGTSKTAAKVTSIVAGAGIDVNNSGVGAVTVTAETASATNPGIVELATTAEALAGSDTTRAVTAAGLAARSYRAAIGGATSINVDHGLNTRDVNVQMYDASSYETVMAQVVRSTAARVVVTFNSAPSAGDVIILITKVD